MIENKKIYKEHSKSYLEIANIIHDLNSKHKINIYVTLKKKSFDYTQEFLKDLLIKLRENNLVDRYMNLFCLEETIIWHLMDFYTVQENQKVSEEEQDNLEMMYGEDWDFYAPEFNYKEIEDPIKYIVLMFKRFKEEKILNGEWLP